MFKKLLISSVFVIFNLFNSVFLFSQEANLNFINYGTREGLSSNNVNAILKDSHGYIWFATDDGLNKFDGNSFSIYRHRSNDSTSISSSDVADLYEDRKGNLWIGARGGLLLYNRKLNTFKRYRNDHISVITSISEDKAGSIWLAGYGGVSVLNPGTGRFHYINAKSGKSGQPFYQTVVNVFCDSRDRVWLCTDKGLFLYVRKNKSLRKFSSKDPIAPGIVPGHISSVLEDRKGRLWFGSDRGLSMLQEDKRLFVNFHHNRSDNKTLSSNLVYSLALEKSGKIWVGTEDGLNILDPETQQVTRVTNNPANRYSLVGNSVKSLYVDDNDICWIATFRGGVNKYDKNLAFFNFRQINPSNPSALQSSVVTSFAEVKGKGVYVGTDGGGLGLFDLKTGKFLPTPLSGASGKRGLAILAMESSGDDLWIGTFLDGLYILDTRTGKVRRIPKGNSAGSVSSTDIFCFKRDSRGNMWIGTNGGGVNFYDASRKAFIQFDKAQDRPGIFRGGYIRAIEEGRDGGIWIGSNGSGIALYHPRTHDLQTYNRQTSGLPNDNVLSICATRQGTVWVGTAEGLARFDSKAGKFKTYSEKDGLINSVIYKIVEDDLGKIWLSTNSGISSFDPKTNKFKNYSHYNGVQRSAFVNGSGLKLSDGHLFFGGIDGFNYFHPKGLPASRNVEKIVLTDLKILNRSVLPGEDAEITEHISVAREIHLDYKQNFSLSFAALNYTSPQENRYLYKLQNFDSDWNQVGNANTAAYTNLDPGKYLFRVKATSDAGEWTTREASIVIYVNPPFWLTYYAYFFYFLVIASILWYVRYRGIKKLETRFALEQERLQVQQLIEQERLESERLREFDQLKIKFLTNLSHEFRTPISLILGPVEQMLQFETNTGRSNQLGLVRRNARRLLNLVNQLLDFRNLEEKEFKLKCREGDFVAFARDVAESFRDLAERKQISFGFHSSLKYYFTSFDPDKIERVLFNLLSNAFKFTLKGGEVNFQLSRESDREGLLIQITDNGLGMAETETEKIFTRFYQVEGNDSIVNQGSGIGLSIAKEFVKLHNGTIDVESISGQGSTFSIRLPFKEIQHEGELIEEDKDVIDTVLEHLNGSGHHPGEAQLPVVLIVEDDEDFRYYLKENLKSFYQIVEASNGKEGWQKALSSHPRLIVSDISMPYINGIDLCKKIKSDKRTSHIPVLLLTALTGEEDQLLGLETGANDYMTKPFNFNILNIKIRNLLALNEQFKSTYSKQIKVVPPDVKIESGNEKFLSQVIAYIETNLTNSALSVQDLSKHIGMSRGSLYTKVLELTGETPVEFIRSVKLQRAAVLLEKSDMNIAEVSYSVGFSSPNYFGRAFKAYFKMLPSEYVQLKRK